MRNIGLALQGGGSYTAFTAGVLNAMFNGPKRFMDVNQLHSVSGTSGGAMNAILLGLAIHENLDEPTHYVKKLWEVNKLEKVLKDKFSVFDTMPDELLSQCINLGRSFNESNPLMASVLGEYSRINSFVDEIIKGILQSVAPSLPTDLNAPLFAYQKPFITIAGTEIRTAQAHYFTNNQDIVNQFRNLNIAQHHDVLKPLTLNGLYASMAHPNVFKEVQIGADLYWDGYYTSNPPFFYLFREGCEEVILVRLIQINREDPGFDKHSIHDRVEEIFQNSRLNMEIQMYLLMREVLFENKRFKKLPLRVGRQSFRQSLMYHEIRLLKSGNISDEGYPLSEFVDRLIKLGQKVMHDKEGFMNTYNSMRKRGYLQIISEVDFESETVRSFTRDIDQFIFGDTGQSSKSLSKNSLSGILGKLKNNITSLWK